MRKVNYKGKLSKDIEEVNEKYSFISSNKSMLILDVILGLFTVILGYKINKEYIDALVLGLKTFGVCFGLTLVKGLAESRKAYIARNKSQGRLHMFSKYLKANKINISENDLKSATVSSNLIIDHNKNVLGQAVSYQISSSDKKRMLIEMKESIAESISNFRVRASLLERKEFVDIQDGDVNLYLVESYELSRESSARTLSRGKNR